MISGFFSADEGDCGIIAAGNKLREGREKMFVLTVKMKAKADKLEELKKLFREYVATIRKNEPGNVMFKMHQKLDDPTELFFYEAYKDRPTWADIHMNQPYVAELGKVIPDYLESDMVMEEYNHFD